MSEGVYIFGYSGHSHVVVDSLMRVGKRVLGYFERQVASSNPYDLDYMGNEWEVDVTALVNNNLVFPTVGDNTARSALVEFFTSRSLNQFSVVDPSASVSPKAFIGMSSYVGCNVSVNSMARIGNGVVLNTSSVIEHGSVVGDCAHVAPSAVLCGDVHLGRCSFIGANSVVRQGVRIGERVLVGAGSVVVGDIPDGERWFGNPAKHRIK